MQWFKDTFFINFGDFLAHDYNFLYIVLLFILFEAFFYLGKEVALQFKMADKEDNNSINQDNDLERKWIQNYFRPRTEGGWLDWVFTRFAFLIMAFGFAALLWNGIIQFASLVCIGNTCL